MGVYQQYLLSQYQPEMWGGSALLNKRGKSQGCARRANGYPSNAFAGISKEDIVKKSAEEIVLKIKNNLRKKKNENAVQENPIGNFLESKLPKFDPPAATPQNYLKIVKKFEAARKSYFTKMDRNSLENYHRMQIAVSKNEMDQTY